MIRLAINGKSFVTDNPGGAVRVALTTVVELAKASRDFQINIYIPHRDRNLEDRLCERNISIVYPRVLPFRNRLAKIFWEQVILPFHVVSDGCDYLLNLVNSCPVFQGRVKGIQVIHDLGFLNTAWFTPAFSAYLYLCMRLGLKNRKVTMTTVIAGRISRLMGGDKVHVIPHGFEGSSKSVTKPDLENKYVLFLGSINPRKNLRGLLDAFSRYKSQVRESRLQLYVVGAEKEIFVQESIKTSENVVTHGYVSDAKKLELLLGAQALILPSFEEGFGIPILEALELEVPVLASRLEVFEELFGSNLCYFDPTNIDSIVGCFSENFDQEGNFIGRKDLKSWRQLVQRFDWRENARNFAHLVSADADVSWKAL